MPVRNPVISNAPAPASPSPPGLLSALRLATAAAHASVERLPAMERLTSAAVTLDDYRGYLCAIARLYGTLEPPLYAALRAGLPPAMRTGPPADLGLRPKSPALLRELDAHGLPAPELGEGPVPADLSSALGSLYVLEGATLGGRVIARHLRRYLGDVIPEGGMLDFHGEATSAVWKGFGAALDALAADGLIDPERTVAAALLAFDRVYLGLGGTGGA
jgi:heme oxygenase (biliverdin-IX-beta and delta-forming)